MISIIFPYGRRLARVIDSLDRENCEILVAGSPNKNLKERGVKFIIESNLATSILKCIEESKGEYIVLLNDSIQNAKKCIKEMIKKAEDGADIVIGKRNKKSVAGRMFVNLLFPKSRIVEDPLSEIFLVKREVIKNAKLHPIGNKILLEILAKGKYERLEEVPVFLKGDDTFNERYSTYSKHLLRMAWDEGEIKRFVKFGIVGAFSVLINEFLLWFLISHGIYLLLASLMSIETSILSSFTLNEIWTFRDRGKRGVREFLKRMAKFNFASLIGLLLNLFILAFLTKVFLIHPLKANIAGIAAAFIWNFFAHNLWTWYR